MKRDTLKFLLSLLIIDSHCLVNAAENLLLDTPRLETEMGSSAHPYAFPLSEAELRTLAEILAPRVDLFREIWARDPNAEFYAGTTRDFLYWILKHFRGLKQTQDNNKIKQKLLSLPMIPFREIANPESDADIITTARSRISGLSVTNFGIRKIDFISPDRIDPSSPKYKSEFNQGFISIEKMRLSRRGIEIDPSFSNGIQNLIQGDLQIQFADPRLFWETDFAKQGINHPVLLAIRYLRLIAQDYAYRHGDEIPTYEKLFAPIKSEIRRSLKQQILNAISDPQFKIFLSHSKSRFWLNGSIQKAFRSHSNRNAAFRLMEDFSVGTLIDAFPREIESIHQYLLKIQTDENQINENFSKWDIDPSAIYQKIESALPGNVLYHGTKDEISFHRILHQGIIPSSKGSAGFGFYGVSLSSHDFALNWAGYAESNDLVVEVKLKSSTKFVDITKGPGKKLFSRWKIAHPNTRSRFTSDLADTFCREFGIDLLKYPYPDYSGKRVHAFVLKNAEKIESRRGLSQNPKSFSQLLDESISINEDSIFPFMYTIYASKISHEEKFIVMSRVPSHLYQQFYTISGIQRCSRDWKVDQSFVYNRLFEFLVKKKIPIEIDWVEILKELKSPEKHYTYEFSHVLLLKKQWPKAIWDFLPHLFASSRWGVKRVLSEALKQQIQWDSNFMEHLPALIGSKDKDTRQFIAEALATPMDLPPSTWKMIPDLLSDQSMDIVNPMLRTLSTKKLWPHEIWMAIIQNRLPSIQSVSDSLSQALASQRSIPKGIWTSLKKEFDDDLNGNIFGVLTFLQYQENWPDFIWKQIPMLLDSWDKNVRKKINEILHKKPSWPSFVIAKVKQLKGAEWESLKGLRPRVLKLKEKIVKIQYLNPADCLRSLKAIEQGPDL